jgi:hypothetical protein
VIPLKDADRREFPKLAVYDIESIDWVKVQILCHVDEWGNRREFRTVRKYLEWLLTDFEGDQVWAHFGSGYDNRFLIAELQHWPGASYKAIMSGGLPIIFEIQHEDFQRLSEKTGKPTPRRVTLLDSFRWLPTSLAEIGKSLKQPKMDVDRRAIGKLTRAQLATYCYSDCDLLLRGMQHFRDVVTRQGGTYAVTSASIASNFVRSDKTIEWKKFFDPWDGYRSYSGTHYGRMEAGSKPGMIQADQFSDSAYYGGRCEVFRRGIVKGPLYYYDIASAYPWAMIQKLPFYFLGFQPGAAHDDPERLTRLLNRTGIADATVSIPEGTFEVPPLPVRTLSGKVVFAEGRFVGRWTLAELRALYQAGGKRGVRIDLSAVALFKPVAFAAPLIARFYVLRKEAKDKGDEATSITLKILMNACYGKLSQQLEQSSFVFGDAYAFAVHQAKMQGTYRPSPFPGVSEIVEESLGPFRHLAAGAYVTALARLRLWSGMMRVLGHGGQLYYCDTDSLVTDRPIPGWGGSTALGAWELDHTLSQAEFLCPKVYRATTDTGRLLLRAKGANLRSQLPLEASDADHDRERLLRWLVYAAEISPAAASELAGYALSPAQLAYYGRTEAGLLGFRSSLKSGQAGPEVATLERRAKTPDSKRRHGEVYSVPLYLHGEGGEPLDVRTMDPESLLERELASWQ